MSHRLAHVYFTQASDGGFVSHAKTAGDARLQKVAHLVQPFHFMKIKKTFVFAAVGAESTLERNGGLLLLSLATEPDGTSQVTDRGDGGRREGEREEEHGDAPVIDEIPEKAVKQEEVKNSKGEKGNRFGKLFKVKPHLKNVPQEESSGESPAGLSPPEAEPQQVSASLLLFLTPTNPMK